MHIVKAKQQQNTQTLACPSSASFPTCKITAPESAMSPLQDMGSRYVGLAPNMPEYKWMDNRAARLDHTTPAGPLDIHHFHSLISSV